MCQPHSNTRLTKFSEILCLCLYQDILIFNNDEISNKKEIVTVFNSWCENNVKFQLQNLFLMWLP